MILAAALVMTLGYEIGLTGRLDFWNATLHFDLKDAITGNPAWGVVVSLYGSTNQLAGRCISHDGVCRIDVTRGFYHATAVSSNYTLTTLDVNPQFTLYPLTVNPSFSTIVQPGSMASVPTYTVFTDTVSFFAKNYQSGAITYSGTNATTVVQNAVTGAQTIGGEVAFLPGNYPISATISITTPLTLTGSPGGFMNSANYGTRFYATTAGLANMITMTLSAGGGNQLVAGGMSGIFLDCASKAVVGLNVTGTNDVRMDFTKVTIESCTHLGLYLGSNHSLHFYDLHLALNGPSAAPTVNDGGLMINGANSVLFYGLTSEANYGDGMIFATGFLNAVFGGVIEGNHRHGIYGLGTAQYETLDTIDFESNNLDNVANMYDVYLSATTVSHWTLRAMRFSSTNTAFAVFNVGWYTSMYDLVTFGSTPKLHWSGSAIQGTIVDSQTFDSTSFPMPSGVYKMGVGLTAYFSNQQVTGAVSTLTIAHGLWGAPTIVQIQPRQSGQGLWWYTADATNVVINFANQPGASTWAFDVYASV